jgi:hypothetical protein
MIEKYKNVERLVYVVYLPRNKNSDKNFLMAKIIVPIYNQMWDVCFELPKIIETSDQLDDLFKKELDYHFNNYGSDEDKEYYKIIKEYEWLYSCFTQLL